MPAYFDQGFFVRVPAWHGMGVVLDEYPGREEAMRLAGHDFDVIEIPVMAKFANAVLANAGQPINEGNGGFIRSVDGYVAHVRSDTLQVLNVARDSFERIQNSTAYDVAEILLDQGFKYETGITLKDGAACALTLLLDEPITIQGDDTVTLPYVGLSWAHDGSASLKLRSTSVRQVCANTVAASEAEGRKLGTDFTFRHTKNVKDRIEDAKLAIRGVRDQFAVYAEIMNDLAAIPVTRAQRELFVTTLLPIPPEALISDRVMRNAEEARAAVRALFDGPTIPEAHRFTAYGLQLAGVEYLDHLRGYRNKGTYVGRTLLRDEPAKAKLGSLIKEVVRA